MDGEAGWWTTIGNIGLPPLARAMGVGRQQQERLLDVDVLQSIVEMKLNKLNMNKASGVDGIHPPKLAKRIV